MKKRYLPIILFGLLLAACARPASTNEPSEPSNTTVEPSNNDSNPSTPTEPTTPSNETEGDGNQEPAHTHTITWVMSEEGHYKECSDCKEHITELTPHIPGVSATETTPQTCSICGYEIEPAKGHIHTLHLTYHKAKNATCSNEGNSAYYSCSCGLFFSDNQALNQIEEDSWIIEALPHDYGELVEKEDATCYEDGHEAYYQCSACHHYFDKDKNEVNYNDLIIQANHDYYLVADSNDATCVKQGIHEHYECHNCDKYFDSDHNEITLDSLKYYGEHIYNYNDADDTASCIHDGHEKYYKCPICEQYFDADKNPVSYDDLVIHGDHNYGSLIPQVDATCSSKGTIAHYHCDICNKDFNSNKEEVTNLDIAIDADAHHFGNWNAKVDPTCSSEGTLGYYHCDLCDKNYDADGNVINNLFIAIDADAHHYGDWIDQVDPTTSENGVLGHYHCDLCNKDFDANHVVLESLVIPQLGHTHTYGDLVEEKASTCTIDGLKAHYYCESCEQYFDKDKNPVNYGDLVISAAHNHQFKEFEWDGITAKAIYECSVCHDIVEYNAEVDKGDVIQEATCTLPELTKYTATYDDHEESINIETGPSHHTYVFDHFELNSDCSKAYAVYVCSVDPNHETKQYEASIDKVEITQEQACLQKEITTYSVSYDSYNDEIDVETKPALSHSYSFAGFEWDGLKAKAVYECSVCGHKDKREAEVDEGVKSLDPTCVSKGKTTYTATYVESELVIRNDTKVVEDIAIDENAHDWNEPIYEWNSDHSKLTATRTCKRNPINHYETETVDLDHTDVVDATCVSKGSITYYSKAFENKAFSAQHDVEEIPVNSNAHGWVGPMLKWNDDQSKLQYVNTCSYNDEHIELGEIVYQKSTAIDKECGGGRSELAGSLTSGGKQGDINMYFANGTSPDDRGLGYELDMTLRINHNTDISSMADNFLIKVDNNYHYSDAVTKGKGGLFSDGRHVGSSYAYIATDLETNNKSTYTFGDISDNRSTFGETILGSFEDDYKAFAHDAVVKIHAEYVLADTVVDNVIGHIHIEITYYTMVEEYEKYFGYTQTININVIDSSGVGWSDINSFRITRAKNSDCTITIEDITYSSNLDHDITNTYSVGSTWYKRCIKSIGRDNGDSYVSW